MISDTFSSTHHLRRSGRAPLKASVLALLLLAVAALMLVSPRSALASTEVTPLGEPLGGPLADPAPLPAAPSVTGVSPNTGPASGATKVTITGANLSGAEKVEFGSTPATIGVITETSVTATSPAGTGKQHVTVTTPGGTSATSTADEFTYVPLPTVTKISPSEGPASGGTSVTITGTNLTGATVKFGAAAATGVVVNAEGTSATATSPAGTGKVAVTATTTGGTSAAGAADEFTYVPAPTVTSIEPSSGPTTGGTVVKIRGKRFLPGSTVTIGAAAPATVVSEEEITATTAPAAVGPVPVIVTDVGGSSTGGPTYTYESRAGSPTVTSISPSTGPAAGGTSVTITGTNFIAGSPTVKFGSSNAAGLIINSGTSITAISPAGSGTVHVTVTTLGGTSSTTAADEFTYRPVPAVTGVSPSSGPVSGGSSVAITGSGFSQGAVVSFGSSPAAGVVVNSSSSITATSPAGAGTVHVTVTTSGGASTPGAADEFTYTASGVTGGQGPTGSTGPAHTSTGLPAPVLARTANIATVAGRASIRLPGTRAFVTLSSTRQIPFGTVVEAVHGEVSVTAARAAGGTQRGQFFDGEFVLTQAVSGRVLGTLAGGNFSVCRPQAGAAARTRARSKFAASTHLVRRLWAEASAGSFSTQGRYAGGVVQGAQWLTEDMCEGTLILATRERVEVTDLVRHRHVQVPTGGIYVAKRH